MKVGAIPGVAGAVVGEFLGSDKGLGYLMLQVQVTLDTPAMFMAVLMITAIGMTLYGLVLLLERPLVGKDARLAWFNWGRANFLKHLLRGNSLTPIFFSLSGLRRSHKPLVKQST